MLDLEAHATGVVASARPRQPSQRSRWRRRWDTFVKQVMWLLGRGRGHVRVHYSKRFRMFLVFTTFVSLLWLVIYTIVVLSSLEITTPTACTYADLQIKYTCTVSLFYFLLVVFSRVSLLVPGIVTSYVRLQPDVHGWFFYRFVHAMIHAPHYAFCCSALLFWAQLMQHPLCMDRNPDMYFGVRWHAACSVLAATVYAVLATWHTRILIHISRTVKEQSRRAPPDLINQLQNVTFDEALFGDEDDKRYASQCAICLDEFKEGDSIKLTPCAHTFHAYCLNGWFGTDRTCALCRFDLSLPPSEAPSRSPLGNTIRPPSVIGIPAHSLVVAVSVDDTTGRSVLANNAAVAMPNQSHVALTENANDAEVAESNENNAASNDDASDLEVDTDTIDSANEFLRRLEWLNADVGLGDGEDAQSSEVILPITEELQVVEVTSFHTTDEHEPREEQTGEVTAQMSDTICYEI